MVEWKKLGEVANLVRGRVISKDYIRDFEGEYPVYSSQTANDGVLGSINSYMFDGEYLTWTTDGAYAGTIFRRKGKFSITNVCGLIDITCRNIKQDFLYFWLSKTAKDYVLEGMGNPKLMSNVASTILIPIPSLEEQTRIVGILDTFTSTIDNLNEQIAQRRKQYEYYRNQLLTFDKVGEARFDVKWMKLGEVCDFQNGFAFKSTLFKTQGAPIIRITNINGNYIDEYDMKYFNVNDYNTDLEQYKVYQGDILIAMSGATTGKIGCSLKNKIYYLNQRVGKFIPHKQLDKRYLFHVLSSKTLYLYYLAGGGAQPNLSSNKLLNDFVIPIPPLEEQQRIVSILDTFEASIQNLESQLKERQKQYEYYRNKLLAFE